MALGSLRRVLLAAATLLALGLAAGCGGGDDKDATTQWADDVCSSITTWRDSVTSATDSLKDNPTVDGVDSALGDVKDATSKLVDDIDGLDTPDLEAGDEAKKTLDGLEDELRSGVDEIESAADGASGATGMLSAVSTISGTLATMGSQVSAAFKQLGQLDAGAEIKTAFEQAGSCSSLRS